MTTTAHSKSGAQGLAGSYLAALVHAYGLALIDQSAYFRVDALDGSERSIYISKAKTVRRIDVSRFGSQSPNHPALRVPTNPPTRNVTREVDFAQPQDVVVDAIKFLLRLLSGRGTDPSELPTAVVVPAAKSARRRDLAGFPLEGYREPPEFATARDYFKTVARTLLPLQDDQGDEVRRHVRFLLKQIAWAVTTCTDLHKYNTRYVSQEVRALAQEWNDCVAARRPFQRTGMRERNYQLFRKLVHHEHVVPIKVLQQRLIQPGADTDRIIDEACGCLVTRVEHAWKLPRDIPSGQDGWTRYAEIEVWDRATGTLAEFSRSRGTAIPPG